MPNQPAGRAFTALADNLFAAGALALLVLNPGCAVRRPPSAYRLIHQDGGPLLVPPGVSRPDVSRRTLTTDLPFGPGPCARLAGGIEIRRHRKRARVTVTRDSLLHRPTGWLNTWSAEAESQGCVAPGAGRKLAARVAELLPLAPSVAFGLLHSNDAQTGYVELGPEVRLEVISPILREGAAPNDTILQADKTTGHGATLNVDVKAAPALLGTETAWYAIRPKGHLPGSAAAPSASATPIGSATITDSATAPATTPTRSVTAPMGFTFTPISVERRVQGKVESGAQPATNYFRFPPEAAFYRLFYKAENTEAARSEVVVAAATWSELDWRTRAVAADPGGCDKSQASMCVAIPERVAVNPYIVATVNGSETLLPMGATVRSAIQAAGESNEAHVLPRLMVYKLHAGRPARVDFDRTNPDILGLMLAGGERISWR